MKQIDLTRVFEKKYFSLAEVAQLVGSQSDWIFAKAKRGDIALATDVPEGTPQIKLVHIREYIRFASRMRDRYLKEADKIQEADKHDDYLLSVEEVASLLGVQVATVYRQIQDKRIPAKKIKGSPVITVRAGDYKKFATEKRNNLLDRADRINLPIMDI